MKRTLTIGFLAVAAGVMTLWPLLLLGCTAIKNAGRTINDAADIACMVFGAEHTEALQALSPREWCDLKKNFDPFLDEILSAQRAAGARLGIQSPTDLE